MTKLVPLIVVTLALLPVASQGQVTCGTVVGRGQTVTLTGDLGPCDGVVAAIVVDGGRLDLGGFTITCSDTNLDGDLPTGVLLFGKRARLSNGIVERCGIGVSAGGDGSHRVLNVTARGSRDDGFVVLPEAGRTKLAGVVADANDVDGIRLRGDRSRVVDAIVTDNGEDGIEVAASAERNKIVRAETRLNVAAGILVDGSRNKLVDPMATENDVGIDLDGAANTVRGGTAQANGAYDLANCAGDKVRRLDFATATTDCQ